MVSIVNCIPTDADWTKPSAAPGGTKWWNPIAVLVPPLRPGLHEIQLVSTSVMTLQMYTCRFDNTVIKNPRNGGEGFQTASNSTFPLGPIFSGPCQRNRDKESSQTHLFFFFFSFFPLPSLTDSAVGGLRWAKITFRDNQTFAHSDQSRPFSTIPPMVL